MNLERILTDIAGEISEKAVEIEHGADAKEADAKPGPFGIAIAQKDGTVISAGAANRFPVQSIAKVFALDLALQSLQDRVFERVGREPSGDPFNSLVDLERNEGIPRNPFINAGALAVVDMLVEQQGEAARDAVVDFVDAQNGGSGVELDEIVLAEGGELNRAMLSFMRHHGNIRCANDAVIMDAYARQCAILLDVSGLASAGSFLVDTRLARRDADADCRARQTRTVLALMMTCGHYDASGDIAVRIGLPAKSGVGGGILAVAPEIAAIATWSPNLDQHGNSTLGVRGLEMLVARTGWSVFGPPLDVTP